MQKETWAVGYLSGLNVYEGTMLSSNAPNHESVFLYVDKFCRENPLERYSMALIRLIRELGTQRR